MNLFRRETRVKTALISIAAVAIATPAQGQFSCLAENGKVLRGDAQPPLAGDIPGYGFDWIAYGQDRLIAGSDDDVFNGDRPRTIYTISITGGSATIIGSFTQPVTTGPLIDVGVGRGAVPGRLVGRFMVAPNSGGNLDIFDVDDPNALPVYLSTLDLPGNVIEMEANANTVFAVSDSGRLDALDLSDPFNPGSAGTITAGFAPGESDQISKPERGMIAISEFSGPNRRIRLLDVSDPAAMSTIASTPPLPSIGLSPTIVGNAVAVTGDGRFEIFDIFPGALAEQPPIADPYPVYEGSQILALPFSIVGGGQGTLALRSNGFIAYAVPKRMNAQIFEDRDGDRLAETLLGRTEVLTPIDYSRSDNPIVGSEVGASRGFLPSSNTLVAEPAHAEIIGSTLVVFFNGLKLYDLARCGVQPRVISGPFGRAVAESSQPINLQVDSSATLTYEWRFNGATIGDNGIYSGSTTSSLTIQPSRLASGVYEAILTNGSGSVTSQQAIVAVTPTSSGGSADVTTTGATVAGQPGFGVPDGSIDLDDLGFFLGLWLQP
ncbi:MAG: immunoglobulin domain-containing protein [Planctomycetota bacterium]